MTHSMEWPREGRVVRKLVVSSGRWSEWRRRPDSVWSGRLDKQWEINAKWVRVWYGHFDTPTCRTINQTVLARQLNNGSWLANSSSWPQDSQWPLLSSWLRWVGLQRGKLNEIDGHQEPAGWWSRCRYYYSMQRWICSLKAKLFALESALTLARSFGGQARGR